MSPDLREELRQRKPFTDLEQEAQLSVVRTASLLADAFEQMLRPYGITATQYNVLRILRGAGKPGLCRNDIRDRLVAQVPDVTRLLDRMEEAELIERARDTTDRRMVTTTITARGLRLLDELEEPVLEVHRQQLGHMSKTQLRALIDLLAIVREPR